MDMTDDEFLFHAMKRDPHAFAFVKSVVFIVSMWDDLYDADVERPKDDINQMMWAALIEIPSNPFYRAHFNTLHTLLRQGILDWFDANVMEAKPGIAREIAHVARYGLASMIVHCAFLVGGMDWAREVGPHLRLRSQKNSFADYNAEMEAKYPQQTKEPKDVPA